MAGQNFDINKMFNHSGRVIKENNTYVNLADIIDRFNRTFNGLNALQTAETYPVISLKSNYGFSILRDEDNSTGTGSVTNNVGDGFYTVSTGSSGVGILDSVERGRYVSGTIAVPGVGVRLPQAIQGDEVAHWGYFNDNDGIGFGVDGTLGPFVFRRFEGSETRVYQNNWNDPLDGAGPSRLSFTLTNVNIYQMPYRWYGSGPAQFEISGNGLLTDTIFAHVIEAPAGEPILNDPNLQLRAEIDNGTTGRDITIEVYGRQFGILGRYNPNRRITGDFRISQSVGTSFVPLISFRQKPTFDSVSVKTSGLDLIVANSDLIFEIRVGALLTGASFGAPSDIPASETALEFDTDAGSLTNGQTIYTGIADAGVGTNSVGSGRDIPELDLPVNENITLCARSVSGTATVTSVFRAREEW